MKSEIEKIKFVGIEGDLVVEMTDDNMCLIYTTSVNGIFKIPGFNMQAIVDFFEREVKNG